VKELKGPRISRKEEEKESRLTQSDIVRKKRILMLNFLMKRDKNSTPGQELNKIKENLKDRKKEV
jgi:hypothetical protein